MGLVCKGSFESSNDEISLGCNGIYISWLLVNGKLMNPNFGELGVLMWVDFLVCMFEFLVILMF